MRDPEAWFLSQYTSESVPWFAKLTQDGLRRRQRRFKRLAQVIKQRRGCANCGYNKTASGLDFDHLPGYWKIFNLSGPPDILRLSEFKQEIAKCQVLCATCHRETTAQRKRKTRRGDDPWVWFRTASDRSRRAEVERRLGASMVLSPKEATAQANVFFALRELVNRGATSNEENAEYSRLCAAIIAGAPPKPERKAKPCAW